MYGRDVRHGKQTPALGGVVLLYRLFVKLVLLPGFPKVYPTCTVVHRGLGVAHSPVALLQVPSISMQASRSMSPLVKDIVGVVVDRYQPAPTGIRNIFLMSRQRRCGYVNWFVRLLMGRL